MILLPPLKSLKKFFRELCLQIGKECRKFIKAVGGARVVCVYGWFYRHRF